MILMIVQTGVFTTMDHRRVSNGVSVAKIFGSFTAIS